MGADRLGVFTRAQCGGGFMIKSRYPSAIESSIVTGHAADSRTNTIYAQIPDGTQPAGPPYSYTSATAKLPTLSVMDADNFTHREKLYLPENITGRSVLSASAGTMYAISDSGLMVLPVGSMNKFRRKKGERSGTVRTLLGHDGDGRQVERVNAGQYL